MIEWENGKGQMFSFRRTALLRAFRRLVVDIEVELMKEKKTPLHVLLPYHLTSPAEIINRKINHRKARMPIMGVFRDIEQIDMRKFTSTCRDRYAMRFPDQPE